MSTKKPPYTVTDCKVKGKKEGKLLNNAPKSGIRPASIAGLNARLLTGTTYSAVNTHHGRNND
jgi:hypothetical protein